jgi:DNA-binding response OmpR family regulator
MAQNSSAHRRALIVEDEPWFAMGLTADMQALGFDCDLAANSQDAFLQAMEDAPDIVLMDLMMPIMDGVTLIKNLRGDDRTSHIPIILLTARDDGETRGRATHFPRAALRGARRGIHAPVL